MGGVREFFFRNGPPAGLLSGPLHGREEPHGEMGDDDILFPVQYVMGKYRKQ